jgi:DNA primase
MKSISPLRNTVKLSTLDIEQLPRHKKKSPNEWSSACPFCNEGDDRFIFTVDKGAYWCRICDVGGYVGEQTSSLTDGQWADIERRKRQTKQVEQDRQRTALECLQAKRNDLIYHRNLNGQAEQLKTRWGLDQETIDQFSVGYCTSCPTSVYSDSFTIPYFWGESLINLRHRLLSPNGNGKYRPEAAGLPTAIFNANVIKEFDWIVLVEGEFKAMILVQYGISAIAIPGATNFKEKWLSLFSPKQTVYVALDPGVEKSAIKIVRMFSASGLQARLVSFPTKPDDFFTIYGGTLGQFCQYLEAGRIC